MKEMDCVEVTVEKKEYAENGVHKGMQGCIWKPEDRKGMWEVLIPQFGEKEDIAYILIKEEDLVTIPKMDAHINEQIKAQFDTLEQEASSSKMQGDESISDYLI